MAQTKRKRRNKHRGNAVGAVEARGRTTKPREGAKPSGKGGARSASGSRGARPLKQPTLNSAALKALFGVVILFVFFQISSKDVNTTQSLFMCLVAFVLYTPLMYMTDKWIYAKKLKQQGRSG
jgi:hypothetical protein